MKVSILQEKKHIIWQLVVLFLLFFLLRFPSLFEPYWYGDEGIYATIGRVLRNGGLLYRDIWDNKPPLLYLIYALWNGDLFLVRFTSFIFGLLSIIVFYFLALTMLEKRQLAFLGSSILGVLIGLPTYEGNIANAENFMLLFSVSSALLVYRTELSKSMSRAMLYIFIGFLLGVSFLFKVVAVFDAIGFVLFIFFVITQKKYVKDIWLLFKKNNLHVFSPILFMTIGFFIPIVFSILFFIIMGASREYITSTFSQNVGYVGWKNTFIIPQGFLLLKSFLLVTVIAGIYFFRMILSKRFLFISLWTCLSLYSAFFSGRPYIHYQLIVFPAVALLFAMMFAKMSRIDKMLTISIFFITAILLYKNFDHWNVQRTVSYYDNFVSFITGKSTIETYQGFFDQKTPGDYAIATYIKRHTKPEDIIFLWGNNAQLYTLSNTFPPGRFVVAYHILMRPDFIGETNRAIEKKRPKYIIMMSDQRNIPLDLQRYRYRVSVAEAHIYERTL